MRLSLVLFLVACGGTRTSAPPTPPGPAPIDCDAFCERVAEEGLLVNVRQGPPCRDPRGRGKGSIEGLVADAGGAPAGGLTVVLSGDADVDKAFTETAADGTFRFDDLPAGRYALTYSSLNGNERLGVESCVVVDGDGAPSRVSTTLTADPCAAVQGGGRVDGTVTVPFPDDRYGGIYVNAWSRAGCMIGATVANPDGTFNLTDLPDGEHTIVVIYAGVQKEVKTTIASASTATLDVTIPRAEVDAVVERVRTFQRCGCRESDD